MLGGIINLAHAERRHECGPGSLALEQPPQQPEAGGDFEYCPNIRSPPGENYGDVGSVVRGETRAPINVITLQPGELQLFKRRDHGAPGIEGTLYR